MSGAAYGEKRQFEKAISDFAKGLQLDPRQAGLYEGMGEVCFKTRQYQRALAYLDRCIALDNSVGDGYFFRASTYKALGKEAEAASDFRRADKLGFKIGKLSEYMMK